jgi:hypothetical protein
MAKKIISAKPELRDRVLSLRMKSSVYEALTKAAHEDNRSLSVLNEMIVSAWLREHGFLK